MSKIAFKVNAFCVAILYIIYDIYIQNGIICIKLSEQFPFVVLLFMWYILIKINICTVTIKRYEIYQNLKYNKRENKYKYIFYIYLIWLKEYLVI